MFRVAVVHLVEADSAEDAAKKVVPEAAATVTEIHVKDTDTNDQNSFTFEELFEEDD